MEFNGSVGIKIRTNHDVGEGAKRKSYCTSVNMMALGTMSIIVRRTMLKYELINNSVTNSQPLPGAFTCQNVQRSTY